MLIGLDILGLAHPKMDLKGIARAFPDGWALGVFGQAFGDALPAVEKFVRELAKLGKKLGAVRVQLYWHDDHKIAPLKFLKREAPRWNDFALRNPEIPVYVSYSCEYTRATQKECKERVNLMQQLCPNCKLVQSPGRHLGKQAPYIKGVGLLEEHGTQAKKGTPVVSADGICSADINTPKWLVKHAGAELVFLHAPRFNLQHHVKPPKKLPPRPKRQAVPSTDYITHIVRQAQPVPDYNQHYSGPEKTVRPKKPNLWKTVAEDSNPGPTLVDPRGTKPMYFIARRKNKKTRKWVESPPFLEIVNRYGAVIGRLNLHHDDDEDPNRETDRYYAGGAIGLHGFQIADRAVETSGSPFIGIRVRKRVHWPIHGALRMPFFQKSK